MTARWTSRTRRDAAPSWPLEGRYRARTLTDCLPLGAIPLRAIGRVSREQQRTIDRLIEETRVLKEQLGCRRFHLPNDQRRRLAGKGELLGRRPFGRVSTVFTPDTIMRWYRQLIAVKWP